MPQARPLDPMLVLILFLLAIFLASLGVFNPLQVGLVGVLVVFLLFIEPYLEKLKIIETGEQKFLYSVLVIMLALFIYGLEQKGYIPVMSLTGNLVLDEIISVGTYTLILILVLVLLLVYYYKDRIKKYLR